MTHIRDEVRKQLRQMKNHPGAKILLDVGLERRPSAKIGAGDYSSEVARNPGADISQSELVGRNGPPPRGWLPRGPWAPTGPASIKRTPRDW
jgi:hypothetical protein